MMDSKRRLAYHESRRMAHIHVRRDECKGCRFCVVICPKQVYEMTDRYNVRGYRVPEVCDEAACVACQRCETICPELAIYIESV
jgi:2-oxoglutarate ferredoxin oxidoreductase subunit delta